MGPGTGHRGIAIVTGAGRMAGIGRAASVALAGDGWSVVVTERTTAPLTITDAERAAGWNGASSVTDEIRAAGGTAWNRPCDVSDSSSVDALVDFAADHGALGVVVNNAGTHGEASSLPLHETPESVWARTLDINVTGVYRMARSVVPVMLQSVAPVRSMINVSSTAAVRVLPHFGAYAASKAAVDGITRQLAVELGPHGIRVNAISPGATSTDMMQGTFARTSSRMNVPADAIRHRAAKSIPLGRLADASEQAAVIAFLASPAAAYVTGQIVQVDGGLTVA